MSAAQFDLGLRLAAHERHQLMARTATRRFHLQSDAVLLAVVASPGDHSGVWGMAWAARGGRPTVASAPDPRPWSAQVSLWEQAGVSWGPWLTRCVQEERPAQFVVADTSAAERLAWSARKVASADGAGPQARAAARAFIIAHTASRNAGQQSIAAMTQVLREHYVSGADPLDEVYLGLWAAWPTTRPGWDLPQVGLPPGSDAEATPLGKAWDRMIRHHERDRETGDVFGQNVVTQIRRLLTARWDTLRASTDVFRGHPGAVASGAAHNAIREGRAFARLMSAERLPATRSVKARWIALADRESAAETWTATLREEDPLERARGAASGDILEGVAVSGRVLTVQPVLRVRPGDRLMTAEGPRFKVVDLDVVPAGIVVVTDCPGLAGPVQAWPAPFVARSPIPQDVPWTHDASAAPSPFDAPAGDLLERVARLRG